MSPHQALWSLFKVGEDNFVKFRNLLGCAPCGVRSVRERRVILVIVSLLYYFILFDHRECVSSCYWVMKEQALYPSSIVVDSEYGFSLLWVFICFRYCVVDSVPICWCELLSELLPYSLLDYANCSCIAPTKEHSISYSCCANGCRLAGVLFPFKGCC